MKHWTHYLTDDERNTVEYSQGYARHHFKVAIPGRNLVLLIDKLAQVLEDYDKALISHVQTPVVQQVSWNGTCWRDLATGVLVDLPPKSPDGE